VCLLLTWRAIWAMWGSGSCGRTFSRSPSVPPSMYSMAILMYPSCQRHVHSSAAQQLAVGSCAGCGGTTDTAPCACVVWHFSPDSIVRGSGMSVLLSTHCRSIKLSDTAASRHVFVQNAPTPNAFSVLH